MTALAKFTTHDYRSTIGRSTSRGVTLDVSTSTPRRVNLRQLPALAGQPLGHSRWHDVTQDEVDRFATLTGDEQWIHVDPARACASGFGTTIAHGYFTLSLSTAFLDDVVRVEGAGMVLNYGSNRVRYPAPLPVGSRLRAAIEVASVEEVAGGLQVVYRLTYEADGVAKPVCVADIVFRYYETAPGAPSPPATP
jgi:acyl dehydratase